MEKHHSSLGAGGPHGDRMHPTFLCGEGLDLVSCSCRFSKVNQSSFKQRARDSLSKPSTENYFQKTNRKRTSTCTPFHTAATDRKPGCQSPQQKPVPSWPKRGQPLPPTGRRTLSSQSRIFLKSENRELLWTKIRLLIYHTGKQERTYEKAPAA